MLTYLDRVYLTRKMLEYWDFLKMLLIERNIQTYSHGGGTFLHSKNLLELCGDKRKRKRIKRVRRIKKEIRKMRRKVRKKMMNLIHLQKKKYSLIVYMNQLR